MSSAIRTGSPDHGAANMPPVEGRHTAHRDRHIRIGTAGFAAAVASLRSDSKRWTPAHSLRVRAIVSTSLNVAFESVLPLIAAMILRDGGLPSLRWR